MQKMSFIHVLMTFYKRDTMIYVGRNWRGTGHLLLVGLCAYCAIFIAYAWSKHAKETYENFYRPVVAKLPPVSYKDDHFAFDAKMPVTINHPITGKKAIYIDTTTDEIAEAAKEYRTVITKENFILNDIPIIPRDHSFTHNAVFFMFVESPFKSGEFIKASDLVTTTDKIADRSHFGVYLLIFILILVMESCKTLFITLIVMFMFRNGGMGKRINKDFKMVNRLCILTYLPVLLVNSLYLFLMSSPGIFMLITTSFVHIILLMSAIHVNTMEDEGEKETKL